MRQYTEEDFKINRRTIWGYYGFVRRAIDRFEKKKQMYEEYLVMLSNKLYETRPPNYGGKNRPRDARGRLIKCPDQSNQH